MKAPPKTTARRWPAIRTALPTGARRGLPYARWQLLALAIEDLERALADAPEIADPPGVKEALTQARGQLAKR